MPSHIILLCPLSDAVYLMTFLNLYNPGLVIKVAPDKATLEAHLASSPADVRLIGFCTPVIVPAETLARLAGPAYNIHPASHEYPGKYPAEFAFYDHAKRFGATAHEMAAQVDTGPIVGAICTDAPPIANLPWFLHVGKQAAVRLFFSMAPAFATSPAPLERLPLAWGDRRCGQKDLDALCALPSDIDEGELERRIAAFSQIPGARFHTLFRGRRFDLAPQSP